MTLKVIPFLRMTENSISMVQQSQSDANCFLGYINDVHSEYCHKVRLLTNIYIKKQKYASVMQCHEQLPIKLCC